MTTGDTGRERSPLEVRTRFERFPATVKGAFVMRGADGNPHTARLERAAVARLPTGPEKAVAGVPLQVDVAPNRDLYVPFEASLADLEPGWYSVRSWIEVDGGHTYAFDSRAFSVAWPRSEVRRGNIAVAQSVRAGTLGFRIERVELGADSTIVTWGPEAGRTARAGKGSPAAPEAEAGRTSGAELVLVADGDVLEIVPTELIRPSVAKPGPSVRTVGYPVPRAARALSVSVRLPSGEQSRPIALALA
jgi:hypothetical protein